MPTAVIIGFQYSAEKELLSTITDIYIAYSFYRDLGFRLFVCMDAAKVNVSQDFTRLMVDGIVDEGYEYFVMNIQKICYSVYTKKDFEAFFQTIHITPDQRVVYYYSGHGESKGIILPDFSVISGTALRSLLFSVSQVSDGSFPYSIRGGLNSFGTQIFMIMDCCDSNDLYLPFKFDQNKYVDHTNVYTKASIILIASSDAQSPTIAHKSESPFTRDLFRILRQNENVDLPSIVKKLSHNTTAYASYASLFVLWTWTFSKVNAEVCERLNAILVHS